MAWKGREEGPIEFNELLTALNNSKVQQSNNALYQTIYQLILKSQQQRIKITKELIDISNLIATIGDTIINNNNALINADYLTHSDESLLLPDSRQLLAGDALAFDDTVANERTVNVLFDGTTITLNGSNELQASGTLAADYVVMSDGANPPSPMDDGAGNFIYVGYTP